MRSAIRCGFACCWTVCCPAPSWPMSTVLCSASVRVASRRRRSMPKPASRLSSFMIRTGRIRSGVSPGRARPISMLSMVASLRKASSRMWRAPWDCAFRCRHSRGSSRSRAAMISSRSPIGSGRLRRTAKQVGARSGQIGSWVLPKA